MNKDDLESLNTILDKMKAVRRNPDRYDQETKDKVLNIADRALSALENEKAEPEPGVVDEMPLDEALQRLDRSDLIRKPPAQGSLESFLLEELAKEKKEEE